MTATVTPAAASRTASASQASAARPARTRSLASLYVRLALLLYPLYAVLTPAFETPDEHSHLFRAYQLSRGQLIAERRGEVAGGFVPAAYARAAAAELGSTAPHLIRTVPERSIGEAIARRTPVTDEPPRFEWNAALYSPAGYLPQIVAIRVGTALRLPVEDVVRLGRLANAALAIALTALALRLLPVGGLPLLVVALLPMTAASAAAFGQDGVVMGASFLLVALGLRASLRGRWGSAEYLGAGVAAAVVTLAKVVYAPLAAVALFPLPRGPARPGAQGSRPGPDPMSWTVRIALVLGLALVLLAVWLTAVRGLAAPARASLPTWSEQWQFIVTEPVRALKAIVKGAVEPRLAREAVGVFGWLTVGPSRVALWCAGLATAVALLAGDPDARLLGWARRVWYLVLAGGILLAMSVVLYLIYTPLGGAITEGLQGRYVLPILPLALLALVPARRLLPAAVPARPIVAGAMVVANLASLLAIAQAFYHK